MSLADRARTALWGNINAILARLEQSGNDAPGLLEQMGQEIHKAKRELLRVLSEEKVLRERSKSHAIDAHQWQSRAELAVRAAEDQLARDALVQYRRLQGESARDAAAADESGALAQSIRADIALMEQKHRGWAARQSTISTMTQQSRQGGGVEALGAQGGRNPFEQFRRAEQSIEDAEFSADAQKELQDLLSPGKSLEQKFANLPEPQVSKPSDSELDPPSKDTSNDSTPRRRVRVD